MVIYKGLSHRMDWDTEKHVAVLLSDQEDTNEPEDRVPAVAVIRVDVSMFGEFILNVEVLMNCQPTDLVDQVWNFIDKNYRGYNTDYTTIEFEQPELETV